MDNYEYMFIPINQIPQEIIDHYHLQIIAHKGKVYVEIRRGMYGLPQAGILAENNLSVSLAAMVIPLFTTHPDYGATNGAPSPSAWSSMILASNTLAKNMPTTSSNASATITKNSKSTGPASASVAST